MSAWTSLSVIRRFDAYPKTLEDFRIKTFTGAVVTIVCGIFMAVLFVGELRDYLVPEITEEIFVDIGRQSKLKINVDVVFHKVPCTLLSIDAMDVSGVQHINVDHSIFKRRLDPEGKSIHEPEKENKLGDAYKDIAESMMANNGTEVCGSCYGAEIGDIKCCNTCEDIRDAYRKKGWHFQDATKYEQCVKEGWTDKIKEQENEGCHVYGFVEVNRVAGNFHIAPGHSFQQHHVHVHDLQPFTSSQFNLTHTIKRVFFGDSTDEGPLDNLYVEAPEGAMMFQYYAKIVPSTFVTIDRKVIDRTQFSVTRHSKRSNLLLSDQGMPGFFIVYELAPMMVKYTEKNKSFLHFLTGLCSIIGGLFTVAGLVDSFIYHSGKAIQQKIEIGKVQ